MSRVVVLNTRPRNQASELSRLLREASFEAVEAPAIGIVAAWNPTELAEVRRELERGRFDWVVLPSTNAGRGLESELRSCRVVCGAATAKALGLQHAVELARFSAATALEALRPLIRQRQRILVPRAAEGRDELIDGLRSLQADVIAPVAYRTVATDAASARLQAGGIDVVTLCSPSAVGSVAPALRGDVLVVCLGATTAAAARDLGMRVDGIAPRTTMEALVEAVSLVLREVRV